MNTHVSNVHRLLELAAQRLVEDFLNRAKAVDHPGARGSAREDAVRKFLQEFLPQRFGVGTGFLVDSSKTISKQIDIVIYDRLVGTVLKITDQEELFPVESVCGVGEVKSDLSSQELRDGLEKVKSAKRLDKTGGGANYQLVGGGVSKGKYSYENYHSHIFGFVFGWSDLTQETIRKTIMEWCAEEPRKHWPNIICVLNRGLYFWKTPTHGIDYNPLGATRFAFSSNLSEEQVILWFLSICSLALASAHVATFNLALHIQLEPSQPLEIDINEDVS